MGTDNCIIVHPLYFCLLVSPHCTLLCDLEIPCSYAPCIDVQHHTYSHSPIILHTREDCESLDACTGLLLVKDAARTVFRVRLKRWTKPEQRGGCNSIYGTEKNWNKILEKMPGLDDLVFFHHIKIKVLLLQSIINQSTTQLTRGRYIIRKLYWWRH